MTLKNGPFGIESQLDSDSVILPLANFVKTRPDAGAFVIACYSTPGIDTCRSVTSQPVFGIQESVYLLLYVVQKDLALLQSRMHP